MFPKGWRELTRASPPSRAWRHTWGWWASVAVPSGSAEPWPAPVPESSRDPGSLRPEENWEGAEGEQVGVLECQGQGVIPTGKGWLSPQEKKAKG